MKSIFPIPGVRSRDITIGTFILFLFLASSSPAQVKEYEIHITKGVYGINSGDYASAIEHLEKALENKPGDKKATLYLGIAYSRSKDYRKARRVLEEAFKIDPGDKRIRYELGVVLFNLDEREEAGHYFTKIAESKVDEDVRAGSRKYLDIIRKEKKVRQKKQFSFSALTGVNYDSNVILEPSAPFTSGEKKDDWRALIFLGAGWNYLKKKSISSEVEYQFYQSVHTRLDEFDIHQHDLVHTTGFHFSPRCKGAFGYRFSYSRVGGDLYSKIHYLIPTVQFLFSPRMITELHYTHEFKDYSDSTTFPTNSIRSGDHDAVGVTQNIGLGKGVSAYLDYTYDTESTEADFWDYSGHRLMLGLSASLSTWRLYLNGSYGQRDYRGIFPGLQEKRDDEVQEYSLYIIKNLTERIRVQFSEYYINNSSNLVEFDYTRNITGLFLEVRL